MDTRWRKFATSGMIVKTSGHSGLHPNPSCVCRQSFLGFGNSFGRVKKNFGMSKNCRRSSRSCNFAWTSCVHLVHRVAIVCTFCWFMWPSTVLCVVIGDTRHFLQTMTIRWTRGAYWWSREGYTTSRGLRIAIVWHFNCIAIGSRYHQRKLN